jgi:hypothetical protein
MWIWTRNLRISWMVAMTLPWTIFLPLAVLSPLLVDPTTVFLQLFQQVTHRPLLVYGVAQPWARSTLNVNVVDHHSSIRIANSSKHSLFTSPMIPCSSPYNVSDLGPPPPFWSELSSLHSTQHQEHRCSCRTQHRIAGSPCCLTHSWRSERLSASTGTRSFPFRTWQGPW